MATATKATHTAGPWTTNQHRVLAADGSTVCDMMPHRDESCNERLITASPDLLAACKDALDCMEHSQPPEGGRTDAVCQRVRAAIAKAEVAP